MSSKLAPHMIPTPCFGTFRQAISHTTDGRGYLRLLGGISVGLEEPRKMRGGAALGQQDSLEEMFQEETGRCRTLSSRRSCAWMRECMAGWLT